MINAPAQIQKEVREIVGLLMQRPITEAIAMRVEAIEGFEHLEIVNGEWVGFEEDETMGGEQHGWIETLLIRAFSNWAVENRAGRIYTGDTNFVLDGESGNLQLKRRPDIAYMASNRLKKSKGYIYGAPDLAIEVISPSERPNDIQKKLREYLEFGVKQVWQVYPDTQEIIVHLPDNTSRTYRSGDTITGGELLAGFNLVVATIFDE
jgi:Uma2 family endonuclease